MNTKNNKSNVELLAALAGPVILRGYAWMLSRWTEFAVTNCNWAWIDDNEGGVVRTPFTPEDWQFYLV